MLAYFISNLIWKQGFEMIKYIQQTIFVIGVIYFFANPAFSQENSTRKLDVSGTISVTNEGISTVPSLSLGEPAALFNVSVGKRFRFEPEFRFSLEGVPWSILFWFRYDVIQNERFQFRAGFHPALSFKTVPALIHEVERDAIEVRRFLAGDLTTNYRLTDKMNVGTYYLYSHGFDPTVPDNTHYMSFYSSIGNISLSNDFYLSFRPQVYYLKIDRMDGFYAAANIALGMKDIPVTVSSTINKVIDTQITNTDPLWNISLNYSFRF